MIKFIQHLLIDSRIDANRNLANWKLLKKEQPNGSLHGWSENICDNKFPFFKIFYREAELRDSFSLSRIEITHLETTMKGQSNDEDTPSIHRILHQKFHDYKHKFRNYIELLWNYTTDSVIIPFHYISYEGEETFSLRQIARYPLGVSISFRLVNINFR